MPPACSKAGSAGRRPRPATLFRHLEMTQRARRRHRRSRGSVRRKVLVAFGIVLAAVAVAIGGRRGLRAQHLVQDPGSQHLEADQGELDVGRIRGRRQPPGLHPVGHDPPSRGAQEDPDPPPARHGRDRGPQLLQARRGRLHVDRPRGGRRPEGGLGGPGRLDDHPAAGPQPLHRPSPGGPSSERSRRRSWRPSTSRSTPRTRSSPSTSTPPPTAPRTGAPRSGCRPPPRPTSTRASATSTFPRRR